MISIATTAAVTLGISKGSKLHYYYCCKSKGLRRGTIGGSLFDEQSSIVDFAVRRRLTQITQKFYKDGILFDRQSLIVYFAVLRINKR